jgi:beta-glucosidase
LYVDDIEAYVSRPQRELKGIAKLRIEAGERATAAFPLAKEAFAFWDVARHDWIVEPGEFELSVGASSRDIRSSKRIFLDADAKLV